MLPFQKILNIFLRGITLACRFIFVFVMARFLTPSLLGLYGLFTATVAYALYFVGLDFYTYTTRQILKNPQTRWGAFLKNQIALSASLYLVFIPIILILVMWGLIPINLLAWFLPILILEHVNQELSRLLIAISEQITASIVSFVRQGSWALVAVGLMALAPSARNLETIFALWAFAGASAAIIGGYRIARLDIGGWSDKLDLGWIKDGVRTSIAFLVATLALRGLQTVDRYWLQALTNTDVVGAYVLFTGMAGALLIFLDAGVFAYSYPALIRVHHAGDIDQFKSQLRKMLVSVLISAALFGLFSLIVLPYLLAWIGNDFYIQAQKIYIWLLIAALVNAVGMVPHYALYAQGRDRPIIYSHVASIFVFIGSTYAYIHLDPFMAVPYGLVTAFASLLIWKSMAYLRGNDQPGEISMI